MRSTTLLWQAHKKLTQVLFSFASVQPIHIIGSPGSGVSMIHQYLRAFQNTVLCEPNRFPCYQLSLKTCIQLLRSNMLPQQKKFYVTKSVSNWWETIHLPRIEEYIRRHHVFLIHVVRDPRDVLTLEEAESSNRFFIEPWLWSKSITACHYLLRGLSDYPFKLTIRYEDFALQPAEVQKAFCEKLGMFCDVCSGKEETTNTELMLTGINSQQKPDLLIDSTTIGHWKLDSTKFKYVNKLLDDSEYASELINFMRSYGFFELPSQFKASLNERLATQPNHSVATIYS